jgi:anti-sigma28 factor (negative regulator of flagellin synthesis)
MSIISNNSSCGSCSGVSGAYSAFESRRSVEIKPAALEFSSTRGSDRAEFSSDAINAVKDSGSIRTDLVNSIREQIANGTYETDAKIALTADRITRLFGH